MFSRTQQSPGRRTLHLTILAPETHFRRVGFGRWYCHVFFSSSLTSPHNDNRSRVYFRVEKKRIHRTAMSSSNTLTNFRIAATAVVPKHFTGMFYNTSTCTRTNAVTIIYQRILTFFFSFRVVRFSRFRIACLGSTPALPPRCR